MAAPTSVTTFHLAPDEAAYVEACLARRRELLALADTAPDGRVLARCEDAAVEAARGYGQRLLADVLARRVARAEQKKSDRPGRAGAVGGDRPADPTTGSS
jgi:hypothetical protein